MDPNIASTQAQVNMQVSDESNDSGPQTCLWAGCNTQLKDPEALFMHVNQDHVGRNSRGNLCLECHWDGCTVSKTKRDHLISHIKSHLSYKPYQCESCSSRFKHMSDLKRHQGTHRDKVNSPPNSTYSAAPVGFSADLASPELQAHHINVGLAQTPINQVTGGTFSPINMNPIQPGGASAPAYAPGLPPSPMLTPSMHPHEGGRIVPIDMNNYATTGSPSSINATEANPLVSPSDLAAMTEAMHSLGQTQDVTQKYLPPDLAQGVYLNFLSTVLVAHSQQVGLTSEAYQSLIALSQIDPITLNALIEATATEHLELLQQFHAHLAACMVSDGVIDPNAIQMSPPTAYSELPSYKPAYSNSPQPDTGRHIGKRDLDLSKLSKRKSSEPTTSRPTGLSGIWIISKITATFSRNKARANRNSAPAITKYQPPNQPKMNTKSATLPKFRRNKGDKRLSIAADSSKIFDSSEATISDSPTDVKTGNTDNIQSLLDRFKQTVDRQISTRQTASATGETAESTEKDPTNEPSSPLLSGNVKQEDDRNEQKVDRDSTTWEVSSNKQSDTLESS